MWGDTIANPCLEAVLAMLPCTTIFVLLFEARAFFITVSMCALVCSVSLILYAQWEESTPPLLQEPEV